MKTAIKKYLVVILMFGTFINYANDLSNKLVNAKKVRVEFKHVKKGHTFSIKNEEGDLIYSQEMLISGSYSKIFDLSLLEKGNYTTELEKDFKVVIKYFSYLNGKIRFNKEKTIFKPLIRTNKNLILISKINFTKEPVKIILSYKNEVILSETIKDNKEIFNRIYNIPEKGKYEVTFISNKRSYTQELVI